MFRKSVSFLCPDFWKGQKKGVTNPCNSLIFKSGQKDSNLRPPAPKAGALAGLRHTPKKKTMQPSSSFFRGEGGIRTPGTHCWIRQFSKLLVSATHPPLLGVELRCKSRLFSDTYKRFLSLFLKKKLYMLNYSEISRWNMFWWDFLFTNEVGRNRTWHGQIPKKKEKNDKLSKLFLYLQAYYV